MNRCLFGRMPDGTPVEQYTLDSGSISCDILTYGCCIRALRVPDRSGRPVDVVLGMETLEDCLKQDKYLGAVAGRCCNRIGGAVFTLNGIQYQLIPNEGPNQLHGGPGGFSQQVWTAEEASDTRLVLSLVSPDGDQGYPGEMKVRTAYTLEGSALRISYEASSTGDTVCNLTNHTYFNLSGHSSGPVLDQEISLCSDFYTPTDSASIPTGEILSVSGTPLDLRQSTPIGARIDEPVPALLQCGGYDHNFAVRGQTGVQRPAARAFSPATGITLEVETDLPGIQFYTGNYLDGCPAGKGGAPYGKRWGFCLETQYFPDSPSWSHFPSCVLRAGETWRSSTLFRFSAQ